MLNLFLTCIMIGLVVNLGCLVYVAHVFRTKHRLVYDRTQRLCNALSQLGDTLRIEQRLADIRRDQSPAGSLMPIRFTAQCAEDLVIYDFFKGKTSGFFIEAGAYDGIAFSNTYLLEALGWTGLLVEPHPEYAAVCRANRPRSIVMEAALGPGDASGVVEFTCADNNLGGPLSFLKADDRHRDRCARQHCVLKTVQVTFTSLNTLLAGRTDKVDLLSLDVEGMELDVLHGFDIRRFRPDLIVLESADREHDEEIAAYLRTNDYHAVGSKGCNTFFVPADKRDSFLSLPSGRPNVSFEA